MKKLEWVRCYDNGGRSLDRYTVVYMQEPGSKPGTFAGRGMNSEPFHGIGCYVEAAPGKHLGKRIKLEDLPPACQQLVKQDLGDQV
jgi:hypothetical protein